MLLLCIPLVSASPLFPALGVLGLGTLWLPAPPLSFFFFCAPAVQWFPPPGAVVLGTVWLGFFFLPQVAAFCVVCALCYGDVPPRPPPGGCSWCCAVSRVLLCGVRVWFRLFSVVRGVFLSCSGVWVPCCLVCCRVVLFLLSLAVSRWCWPRRVCCFRAVPCCPVLFFAVFHRVWCRRAVLCVVVFSLMLSGVVLRFVVWSSNPLRRAVLRWVCWSVMLCPLPPADALVVGLLLLPGLLL